MRITKDDLLELIGPAAKVADPKSSMAVLGCILFQADGDEISVRATDLEVAVEKSLDATAEEAAFCVPAKKFLDVVKTLPGGEILLTPEDGWLRIEAGEASFRIATLPAEDFPVQEEKPWKFTITVTGPTLADVLSRTLYAVATEESRFILSGVCFEFEREVLAVATDGHRLARVNFAAEVLDGTAEGTYIVPRKACKEMLALARDAEAVTVSFSDQYVEAEINTEKGATHLTARLIDGQYPDWRAVLPKEEQALLTVDKKAFAEALRRVSNISSLAYKPVRLIPHRDEAKLELFAQEQDAGEAREVIPAEFQGQFQPLAVNARYMLDALGGLYSDQVVLSIHDENRPILIRDNDYLALVMPMTGQ